LGDLLKRFFNFFGIFTLDSTHCVEVGGLERSSFFGKRLNATRYLGGEEKGLDQVPRRPRQPAGVAAAWQSTFVKVV
jgi:hypothetical protein